MLKSTGATDKRELKLNRVDITWDVTLDVPGAWDLHESGRVESGVLPVGTVTRIPS